MQFEYATSAPRRHSLTAVASFVAGLAAFVLYECGWYGLIPCPPFPDPYTPNLWFLIAASLIASFVLGAFAVVKRRRLWWMGLAGMSLSAIAIGRYAYFALTFTGFYK